MARRKKRLTLQDAAQLRPRKLPPKKARTPVFVTHKVRSNWFRSREAWPVREAAVQRLIQERSRALNEVPPHPGTQQWEEAGPTNIGGRMTSIVCHPTDALRLWAGSAGGGVWQSTDGGKHWLPLWHKQPTLNVGALAIDPRQPDTIYCGTGEANLSADSHPGIGLFRSLNGGQTWQLLTSAETSGLPRRIGSIAVDPFNSNHLLLGGVRHDNSDSSGLFRSIDGGATWVLLQIAGPQRYFCHSICFQPTQQGTVYTTIDSQGAKSGIWRTHDGGNTWTQLLQGLPPPSRVGRISLALAPSNPNTIYALIAASGDVDGVLDVAKSTNGGNSWTSIRGNHFQPERQMSYGNTIVVHPQNPQHVLCGGVDLHLTTNGGTTWKQVTHWDDDRGTPKYAHADHHALIMPGSQPGLVYDMNDGGMDQSADGGMTWENRSDGLATNMFYDLEVSQSNSKFYGGGAQDNGTITTITGQANNFLELTGGDGGWIVIDPRDSNHLFTSAQGMRIFRFRSSTGWKDVSPPETLFRMWMVFMAMDANNRNIVFTGSRRVWRTQNDGNSWVAVSDVLDGSDITTIEIARANSSRIYVATENGGFFRSTDGGNSWSGNLASTVLPGRTITRIESRPNNADVVYVSVANFGHSHVFRSTDGGNTWQDIDGGVLPDVPHQSIVIPESHPQRIYVANDVGVFASNNGGVDWTDLTRNLPNVMVVDLVYHENDKLLYAATYGRSIWKIRLN
jgi:photosystem II stability/assembly factor-like uncharacterized protein